jgi:predicted ATPase/class 3 adenylate cyclase
MTQRLPTGTVTFLFTDIQGSTPLWERQPQLMAEALDIHNTVIRQIFEAGGGTVFKTIGDAFQAVFATAPQAMQAAIEGQKALRSASWNALGELKVRMGLHTGEAELDPGGDEYAVSHTKNRVARIMSAAHGGQVLISQETKELVDHQLPQNITLLDLGEYSLKGMTISEHLFQVCAPGLEAKFPPLTSSKTHPHNLPRQLNLFIGRENDISQVKTLLKDHAMVTLTGSGGVGKTRLSIRTADDLLEEFGDGVWYVELASLTVPELLPQTVALILGLREEAGKTFEELLELYLKSRQALLILDNCEHLIAACAQLASHLLQICPKLKVLASSREAMGVPGEVNYHVPSLSIPGAQAQMDPDTLGEYDAVHLFLVRTRDVLPSFKLTKANAAQVVRICKRLDGIPLALELAAARMNVLNTEQLADRLDNAFRLLTGGARTALPRQQTLRATIDWSYQMLNEQERKLLIRLSVFIGGFSLEGAEVVCSGEGLEGWGILDLLASLVNKSMITAERVQGEKRRYSLLEMVRQYGREKLFDAGESARLHNKHLEYFVRFAEQAESELNGAGRLEWIEYVKAEFQNIRQAIEWSFHDPVTAVMGLRIATAITDRFWWTQGYVREGRQLLEKGVEIAGECAPPPLQAKTLRCLGRTLMTLDLNQARAMVERCLALCRQIKPQADREHALALYVLAGLEKDRETALNYIEEAERVTLSTQPYDPWVHAQTLWQKAYLKLCLGFEDQPYEIADKSIQIVQTGDRWSVPGYWVMSLVSLRKKDFPQARHHLENALEMFLEVDDKTGIVHTLSFLGTVHHQVGNFHQAYLCYTELFNQYALLFEARFYWLAKFGLLLVDSQSSSQPGEIPPAWVDAVQLLSAFEHFKQTEFVYFSIELEFPSYPQVLEQLKSTIEPGTFQAAWAKGKKLAGSEEAVKVAQLIGEKYTFQNRS